MRCLVQFTIALDGPFGRDDVRQLARELRDGMRLNTLSQLEQLDATVDELESIATVYAPTITYPLALRAER